MSEGMLPINGCKLLTTVGCGCPTKWVGENAADVGSNAPDGQRIIGPVADNVARKFGRMIVTEGWHGAKYFGAKKKFRAMCLSDMCGCQGWTMAM